MKSTYSSNQQFFRNQFFSYALILPLFFGFFSKAFGPSEEKKDKANEGDKKELVITMKPVREVAL